jgi:hypothetical protein
MNQNDSSVFEMQRLLENIQNFIGSMAGDEMLAALRERLFVLNPFWDRHTNDSASEDLNAWFKHLKEFVAGYRAEKGN